MVLIVGAGPVGLTMASELSRFGVPVRIVDKAAHRTDKSKALVLWSRTLELLERAGCAQKFVDAGQKVVAANIIAGGNPIGHVSISNVKSPYPYALMIPQSETERLLEEHLGSLGITVEREVEVTGFRPSESGVEVTLHHADGQDETVGADWLIGCDGAHSMVRHTLGFQFEGDTLKSDWILADLHMSGVPFPDSEIATYWHRDGVLVVFPISPGRYRVIADIGLSGPDLPVDPTLGQVQEIINQRGGEGMVASNPIWLSAFRINERKVTEYRQGRVFLAGDAAHVHSPAGGQGMNTGMQDAFNLAWKLALVTQGICKPSLLDSYSIERSAIGDQVLEAAGRLTSVAVMKNHAAQAVRNLIGHFVLGLAPFQKVMVDSMTEVSIGYAKSPLTGVGSHGERMAPVAGQVPVGSGSVPKFALFSDGGGAVEEVLAEFSALLEPKSRPALEAGKATLVRPDGYEGCVAQLSDLEPIRAYLSAYQE